MTAALGAAGLLAVGLSACSSEPSVSDLDLSAIDPPQVVAAKESEALNTCMHDAGYPDFSSPPMDVASSLGAVVPLDQTVDSVLAEVTSTPSVSAAISAYATAHGLTGDALETFQQAFLACDDERVASRLGDTDSARGQGQAVISRALQDLHGTPEFISALQTYVQCMRAQGWQVQDNGNAAGIIYSLLQKAVVTPGSGEGFSGLAGAVLDPDAVTAARETQAQLVAADETCGADSLEPVYAPFNETYGALAAALYGVRPDASNRVRL